MLCPRTVFRYKVASTFWLQWYLRYIDCISVSSWCPVYNLDLPNWLFWNLHYRHLADLCSYYSDIESDLNIKTDVTHRSCHAQPLPWHGYSKCMQCLKDKSNSSLVMYYWFSRAYSFWSSPWGCMTWLADCGHLYSPAQAKKAQRCQAKHRAYCWKPFPDIPLVDERFCWWLSRYTGSWSSTQSNQKPLQDSSKFSVWRIMWTRIWMQVCLMLCLKTRRQRISGNSVLAWNSQKESWFKKVGSLPPYL